MSRLTTAGPALSRAVRLFIATPIRVHPNAASIDGSQNAGHPSNALAARLPGTSAAGAIAITRTRGSRWRLRPDHGASPFRMTYEQVDVRRPRVVGQG